VYRLSGSSSAVAKLKATFDCGQDMDLFVQEPPVDPNAIATLVKQYLRERTFVYLVHQCDGFTPIFD
jgi:hypothetical protein